MNSQTTAKTENDVKLIPDKGGYFNRACILCGEAFETDPETTCIVEVLGKKWGLACGDCVSAADLPKRIRGHAEKEENFIDCLRDLAQHIETDGIGSG